MTEASYEQIATTREQSDIERTVNKYMSEIKSIVFAGFWIRFFAYIIDILALAGFKGIVLSPLFALTNIQDEYLFVPYFSVENIISALIFYLYFVLMTYKFKGTLGKMCLGLSVYREDAKPLKFTDVLFREWIGRIISGALLGLPYLVVAFTKKHKGIHDYFGDTVVLKNKYIQLRNDFQKAAR
ncbi:MULTISPECIES: RDD family protein [Mammaliicoccus]|uniref:RDD family protein n=1 Tax=Mammaliicoccus vitulinus TaxID=71237 RepID=A0A2T4PTP8_9STAP|nr:MULTISPECIES: RDD family protein [Mammaliicoccus]HAL09118.1 RDD family protein [Staphylococcus sp.]MBM6628352.1 RDD family protein [Mammaliicoccus vitulinus]MBO3077376.1 RDD family protein [Mammaliicoccus vitulinus]MEB7657043.1 RDD family protein [Mammaliicoccus vitulinus]PNZ39594.1 RDD family protein [Mammaliicoccus vitulinus]